MKWSTENKLKAGFGLALLLAVVIAPVSYLAMNQLTVTAGRINRTHKVLSKLSEALSAMQNVETESRGSALAGDDRFLKFYEPAVAQVGVNVKELQELSAHDPHLAQQLSALAPLLDRKLFFAKALVVLRQRKGLASAAKKLGSDTSRELMDQIRTSVANIQASENLRLSEQEIEARIDIRRAMVLLFALTALIVAQLIFLFHFITLDRIERKRGEEALRESDLRFRIVARATNEAVWDWKLTTNAVWWNHSLQTLFGYAPDQVGFERGWWEENLHPEDRQRVVAGLQDVLNGSKDFWSAEYRFRRADGSCADIFDRGYILRDSTGRAERMIGAMQDITEHKREVETAQSRDAALESARLKSQFLANMSHEIRTPMNCVIGMTGLLLNTKLTEEQREFAETVRLSGESLLTIINDILDFSKIEAGKLTFETVEFDARETIGETIQLLTEQAQAKKLNLSTSLDPSLPAAVRGDPGRVRQVLTNLTSNAIKFTHKGSVVIRARTDSETDTHAVLRFEVADSGIGIPNEARACLFQPFSQVDAATNRRYGGTGLGLAICRELVRLMNGEIGVESLPGQGSTFWFTARFEKGKLPPVGDERDPSLGNVVSQQPASPEKARKRGLILVAEDNVLNQKVILRQLQEMGHSVDAVANGVEVIEALQRIPYDLVLMDCQMPEMDGYKATREIRRRERAGKRIPVIAMTAHVMKEDRDKCLAAGMDDFLSKPVRVAYLDRVLTRWLTKTNGNCSESEFSNGPLVAVNLPCPVDMEMFTEVAGESEERKRDIASRYLRQAGEQLASLNAAIQAGAAGDVKRIAHSLAGSSAMCGMVSFVPLLRELERLGHENNLAAAGATYAQVQEEFGRIKEFLRDFAREELTV